LYPLAACIVVETKEIWEELRASLDHLGVRLLFELSEIPPDWSAFLERIERVQPDLVLLEVTRLKDPIEEVVRQIRSTSGRPAVFALNKSNDTESILAALRGGVSEYLTPPLGEPLKAALERLSQNRERTRDIRRMGGKTLAFISAKGGCGATTVACHIAAELPHYVKGRVLLADLDLQAGVIDFLAKARTPYSIADAVNNVQRLDESYWRALVSNGIPNLEIITAPSTPANKQLSAPQLKQVLAFARTQYDWLVLDLGRSLNAATLSVLDLADQTYLVTTPEIPALHQAKRMVQYLLDSGYPRANLRVVMNRFLKRPDITIPELEEMLGTEVYATIINDYHALQDAHAEGRFVDRGSRLGNSFSDLAARIAGVEMTKKKTFSLFG